MDVAAATDDGITVVNVPDYALEEVSTHAFALLLACARAIPAYDRSVRAGTWDWRIGAPARRMAGRTRTIHCAAGTTWCSPHTRGGTSEESRADLSESVARDVAAVLRGDRPENPVDPETPWV